MKRALSILSGCGVATFLPHQVLAAAGRNPPGDLAILGFLGFCALIVVAQLIPLARRLKERPTVKERAAAPISGEAEERAEIESR